MENDGLNTLEDEDIVTTFVSVKTSKLDDDTSEEGGGSQDSGDGNDAEPD